MIFETNVIQRTWSLRQEINQESTRQGARPPPSLCPRAPPTYFFLLYIPTYPQTIRYGAKNLIPPPQPSIPVRSHLGAFAGAPPEGESITEGFYINTIATIFPCFSRDLRAFSHASSLSLDLNTKFSSIFLEIYSM